VHNREVDYNSRKRSEENWLVWSSLSGKRWFGYGAAVLGIASATGLLKFWGERINPTTSALAFLLMILFVATAWGSRPAVLASLVGVVSFNFFSHTFTPPPSRASRCFVVAIGLQWLA
jgi:K+-sensing histidine kinase KdpD